MCKATASGRYTLSRRHPVSHALSASSPTISRSRGPILAIPHSISVFRRSSGRAASSTSSANVKSSASSSGCTLSGKPSRWRNPSAQARGIVSEHCQSVPRRCY